MIAHLLSEDGWTVLLLGADTPAAEWPEITRARHPDVAVLSTTTSAVLERVEPAVRAIKTARPDCRTILGGQAYWGLSCTAADFGADVLALDARVLPRELRAPG
jgi:methanogenic corrinoid protein MtbC1